MTNVRMRNTFMKVGQSLLVKRQLESENKLKENMIHSLMPSSVACWLLDDEEKFTRSDQRSSDPETNDLRSLFRPFNMNRMENVSILFADIVGFTKMSSKKSAEELVEILNNLFQRFDHLCKFHNCEKISTLGDCYYCVSGCPEPRQDHAKCCVEMGLSMIQAIKQFDQEKNEGVNMRVGVHTGTVLCGIVGTKRFKFDVWSNDVTLANRMESTGRPGMVHVSEKTCEFLQEAYLLEEGESVFGLKTYFILGRAGDRTPSYSGSFRAEGRQKYTNSLQLFISPPTSSPSMSPQTRPRVLSCDTTHMKTAHNPNMLSPDVCKIKASSLPSILDSENEQDGENCKETNDCDNIKTPTSTASSGKYTVKLKSWKMPKFLRKTDQVGKTDLEIDQQVPSNSEDRISTSGGYQQVPTIIETSNVSNGKKKESFISVTDTDDDKRSSIFMDDPKDTIDVKSYISQSRSDVGQYDYSPGDLNQFIRTGSYRSQYSRSPNEFSFLQRAGSNRSRRGRSPNFDILPGERARSATVTVGNIDRPKMSLEVPGKLTHIALLDDHFATQSVHSRKDSGIKSNSRRSSIQQFDNPLPNSDMMQHRVSGYYTSSQSTVNSPQYAIRMPGPFFDKFGACIQNLRKQSDRQLIKCVQENSKSRGSYFIKPPLWKLTLFFKDEKMEQDYRANVHSLFEQADSILTLANSKFNTYFDVCVSSLVFVIVSISLWLLYGHTTLWLVISSCFIVVQALGWALCSKRVLECSERMLSCVSRFYRWNMFGAVLNFLATFFAIIFIPLFLNGTCSNFFAENSDKDDVELNPVVAMFDFNQTKTYDESLKHYSLLYTSEILMDLFLLLVLVWLLNREFEIGYRLSFHANYVSNRDKIDVQRLKNQADYLIYNIVPEHVAEQLKKNAKYSENFKDAGIIFASIVNFNEMYDESYLGGKEFLRVLNELIADFDELLDRSEFASVEKIKTIGSTFMAASGLNSQMRLKQENPNEHLYALMDFAVEMQNVIGIFNRDLLEFNLILRIGYNFGDVTAAVIGNTKLYYDIWGDAVNIASRMDSTGVNGHVQVGEHCLEVLEKKYVFQPRGSVYVKGKDNMNVYLLHHKKSEEELVGA
ncbi:adenylate cyclase type 9 [Asbolus verrucosus]|uniref:Adenylate cyclase type 9 n=1 Tax=Asbolus verrucosus TaxID=1661398 RepID=A0A482VME9_ASBVE|nr:adenylate cyclase type 9 [Asbolus verrucosus]